MDMTINRIRIKLDLQGCYNDIIPEIGISIDDTSIRKLRLDQLNDPLLIDIALTPGTHKLSINFDDHMAIDQDPTIAIEVRSLKFQYLTDEFNIYSFYRPIYPEHWIKENLEQGRRLDPVIHSNHIGWCGQWYINFKTPIYTWIHRQLNMGWLLDTNRIDVDVF